MKQPAWVWMVLLVTAVGCKKDCGITEAACREVVPQGAVCDAYLESWFFSEESNSCKLVGYSGCSHKGFATKDECEACKCK